MARLILVLFTSISLVESSFWDTLAQETLSAAETAANAVVDTLKSILNTMEDLLKPSFWRKTRDDANKALKKFTYKMKNFSNNTRDRGTVFWNGYKRLRLVSSVGGCDNKRKTTTTTPEPIYSYTEFLDLREKFRKREMKILRNKRLKARGAYKKAQEAEYWVGVAAAKTEQEIEDLKNSGASAAEIQEKEKTYMMISQAAETLKKNRENAFAELQGLRDYKKTLDRREYLINQYLHGDRRRSRYGTKSKLKTEETKKKEEIKEMEKNKKATYVAKDAKKVNRKRRKKNRKGEDSA